mgnify:CR=1 FL=1
MLLWDQQSVYGGFVPKIKITFGMPSYINAQKMVEAVPIALEESEKGFNKNTKMNQKKSLKGHICPGFLVVQEASLRDHL